jgi:hypothetical protein
MNPLDRILELTAAVEHQVDSGAWAQAGALDAERRRLLAELCADGQSARELAGFREVLEQVLARTQETIQRVETRQDATAKDSARLGIARDAVRDYRRNTAHGNLVFLRERGDES